MGAKEAALKVIPHLKAVRNGSDWRIMLHSSQYGELCASSRKAWLSALNHIQSIQFKKDDLVVMQDCMEADHYKNKVWRCRTDCFMDINNYQVIFLEGFSGYFHCYYLRLATDTEVTEFNKGQSLVA